MEQIRDDFIIRSMEETGLPPWQQRMDEVEPEEAEEDELPLLYYAILGMIPRGKQNAIRRAKLAAKAGLNDRTVRKIIEKLRRYYIICNDQDGRGYYRPGDQADVRRYYDQEYARALAILRHLKVARGLLNYWEGAV